MKDISIDTTKLSFIIPTFNEERFIGQVLDSIINYTPKSFTYEIITIDNGSTDRTVDICEAKHAKVLHNHVLTIAGLRNLGVEHASGDILVFIDADVTLTPSWGQNLAKALEPFNESPMIITGSRYLPTEEKHWLNKHWYQRMTEYTAPYINSGHLITSRILFEKIGGFTPELKTAEDYDFCMKAKKEGGQLIENKKLPAIHLGYPDNIKDFFKRERWHGKQDFQTIRSFVSSKIALVATFHLVLLALCISLSIIYFEPLYFIIYFGGALIITGTLTALKYRLKDPIKFANTAIIFYIYLVGRSMSLIDRILYR